MTDPQIVDLPIERDLTVLQQRAYANSHVKGFHDHGNKIRTRLAHWQDIVARHGDKASASDKAELEFWENTYRVYQGNRMMLIVGEGAEAHEETRAGREPGEIYFSTTAEGAMKPEGFAAELADLVIRALDTAEEMDIDLAAVINLKMGFNAGRPAKHGKKF